MKKQEGKRILYRWLARLTTLFSFGLLGILLLPLGILVLLAGSLWSGADRVAAFFERKSAL